ncbi:MAG: hypothetical protein CTY34_01275 [Methylobacter sp.]|nr:MAG: hypothetical protein CTY34_01275 [Methylobacter sp.]
MAMKYQQGYNLIEQFIALLIAGMLLSSLLVPVDIQCENQKRSELPMPVRAALYLPTNDAAKN